MQFLEKEDSESSRRYLEEIVCLFLNHFSENEAILQQHLEPYQLLRSHKQRLACKSWVDSSGTIISTRFSSGKVGLNNLGNTCYMNSVLQALFMTKLFRNDILMKSGDTMPLFTKLQMLFVLLQHSRRSTLSPNEILSLARPPGFQPGHQHDSSEFLGYLLDVLHEQEKTMGFSATAVGTSGRSKSILYYFFISHFLILQFNKLVFSPFHTIITLYSYSYSFYKLVSLFLLIVLILFFSRRAEPGAYNSATFVWRSRGNNLALRRL